METVISEIGLSNPSPKRLDQVLLSTYEIPYVRKWQICAGERNDYFTIKKEMVNKG